MSVTSGQDRDWERKILVSIVSTMLKESLQPVIDRLDEIGRRLDRIDEAMSGKVEWTLPAEERERLFTGLRGNVLLMFMETRKVMDTKQALDQYRLLHPDWHGNPDSISARMRELTWTQYGQLLSHPIVEGKPREGLYQLNPNINLKQYDRLCQQPMPCVECTSLVGCAKKLWRLRIT
jgi:hypothetical protein